MSDHRIEYHVRRATSETVVVIERVTLPGVRFGEPAIKEVRTNVPVTVIHHSPTGFEFGYSGSGPADLALNILNWFVPPGYGAGSPIRCFNGFCSRTAWEAHHEFLRYWIAPLDRDQGGQFQGQAILDWIEDWRIRAPARSVMRRGGDERS